VKTIKTEKPKIKVIFIPGNGGGDINDPEGWFPYLKKELEALGLKVISENFPDPIEAKEKIWLPFITKLGADENTILIGHSSGAVAALRYAQNFKILGSVLVSACYTDYPWDWEKIRNNQKWIIQYHSTDDPFIPIEEARYIHQKTNSEYHEDTSQEHYGYPTPKREFPEIVEEIKKHLTP
jgi:uncharacterized protein